jgi:AcrR family transcriptional regulator
MNPRSLSESKLQPPRTKLRRRFREESAQAMLAAAEAVFAERGLHAASMNAIAARAGVAVGTLYNHFKDRDALLHALLAARHADFMARLHETEAKTARRPFADQLTALLTALFDEFEAHRPFLTFVMEDEHALQIKRTTATRSELLQSFEKLARRGVREGVLRASPLHATILLGLVRSLCMRTIETPGKGPALVGELVDFFLRGAGR